MKSGGKGTNSDPSHAGSCDFCQCQIKCQAGSQGPRVAMLRSSGLHPSSSHVGNEFSICIHNYLCRNLVHVDSVVASCCQGPC